MGSLLTLLEVMKDEGVGNLVFSSSCTVYGIPDALPVTEATPTKPASSPYGRTKQMCEDIVHRRIGRGR
ncbi:MAG: NAD-dependent epimerase/dehydratase family protein [Hymenobacter sp.]